MQKYPKDKSRFRDGGNRGGKEVVGMRDLSNT